WSGVAHRKRYVLLKPDRAILIGPARMRAVTMNFFHVIEQRPAEMTGRARMGYPRPPKMVPVGGGGFRFTAFFAVFLAAFLGAFFTAVFVAAFFTAFFGAAFLEVFFATFHSPFVLLIRPSSATSSS